MPVTNASANDRSAVGSDTRFKALVGEVRGLVGDLTGAGVCGPQLFELCQAVLAVGASTTGAAGGKVVVHRHGVEVSAEYVEFADTHGGDVRERCDESGSGAGAGGDLGRVSAGLRLCASVDGHRAADAAGGERVVIEESSDTAVPRATEAHGKQYWNNRRKKEKRKKSQLLKESWRRVDGSGGCISDESVAGTVRTVDTRTAVEVEAAQTLAARRVAENKVAAKLAEHRLRALNDVARTDAVDRLAAARAEKAINQAKAASQKSFKECDESMKSLGSTGSAGEFALKQAVKDARDNEKVHKYVQQQLALTLRYASDDVKRMVAELPEPTFEDEMEVFGDCPSEYNEDQRASYYMEINRRNCNRGEVDRPVADRPREEKLDPQVLMAKYSDGVKLTERELVVLEMAAAAGDV